MILWWIKALLVFTAMLMIVIVLAVLALHAAGVSGDAIAAIATVLGAVCGQLAGVIVYDRWSDARQRLK